ncbi:SWAP/Surp [Sesbania bispinosa]|nr:SWAP/Surp [Sesbania bispinosa]
MDLEVVGRHAMLFDDDGMAAFVNSAEALVEWNSLSIDRYDVRHLLSGPLPPRLKRRPFQPEADLDYERYLDLPSSSSSDEQPQGLYWLLSGQRMECYLLRVLCQNTSKDVFTWLPFTFGVSAITVLDNDSGPVNSAGYRAVAFSYENPNVSTETKDNDTESGFHPSFPVPENLLHNLGTCVILRLTMSKFQMLGANGVLPPNEKVHQIISRTAMFVSKHGSQSEIILRVKQGDNPTFGFLMPDHRLHAYFRFLVDHQELLNDGDSNVDKNKSQGLDQTGGALSLLGSIYGSGEDEDGTTENTCDLDRNKCEGAVDAANTHSSPGIEQAESSSDASKKDGSISKNSIPSLKEKVPVIKRNHSVSTVKTATAARAKSSDALDSVSNAVNKSQTSVPSNAKIELPVVEPPSDLKRVIEKIVEFIIKNGKQFEAVLAEQDRAYGRFPFLLPSNRYHTYYLKVLQTAEESKLPGKGYQKHTPAGRAGDNNTAVHEESDNLSFGSMGSDLPNDMDRKEKFKMIIAKSKKDGQDSTPKDNQSQNTVTMDAAAAAAILQAATRGIKNPQLEIFTKTSSGSGQGLGSDGGYLSSSGSLYSSQLQGLLENPNLNSEASASVPVAKAIAETVAIAAAGEADSSEAHMTKEQKLKAERLKRAKMFAAMIKSGAGALKGELPRALSAEPPGSGFSGSDAETGNLVGKEREGSSVPFEVDNSDKSQKSEEKPSTDNSDKSNESEEKLGDNNERRSKRRGTKHDSSSDDELQHSRHHHKYDSSSDEKHRPSRRRHRESSVSDHEHRHSRRSHKHYSSSDDERRHRSRNTKHKSRSHAERETVLEEGEIVKSDKSQLSEAGRASREASAGLSKPDHHARAPSQSPEITDVSDELRAKIRAMLMANL